MFILFRFIIFIFSIPIFYQSTWKYTSILSSFFEAIIAQFWIRDITRNANFQLWLEGITKIEGWRRKHWFHTRKLKVGGKSSVSSARAPTLWKYEFARDLYEKSHLFSADFSIIDGRYCKKWKLKTHFSQTP